jgi:putative membrane protein
MDLSFKKVAPAIVYIMFSVGFFGHLFEGTRDLMMAITPGFLVIMGLFVLVPTLMEKDYKVLLWAGVVYLLTFAIEVLGVATGEVFGEYRYGPTLGVSLFAVPIVIGFNWTMVILGCIKAASFNKGNVIVMSLLAGALAFIFDYILEPVAIHFDYWKWDGGFIPLKNYISWFIIAGLMALSYGLFKLRTKNDLLVHYLISQSVFFLLIRVTVVGQ